MKLDITDVLKCSTPLLERLYDLCIPIWQKNPSQAHAKFCNAIVDELNKRRANSHAFMGHFGPPGVTGSIGPVGRILAYFVDKVPLEVTVGPE